MPGSSNKRPHDAADAADDDAATTKRRMKFVVLESHSADAPTTLFFRTNSIAEINVIPGRRDDQEEEDRQQGEESEEESEESEESEEEEEEEEESEEESESEEEQEQDEDAEEQEQDEDAAAAAAAVAAAPAPVAASAAAVDYVAGGEAIPEAELRAFWDSTYTAPSAAAPSAAAAPAAPAPAPAPPPPPIDMFVAAYKLTAGALQHSAQNAATLRAAISVTHAGPRRAALETSAAEAEKQIRDMDAAAQRLTRCAMAHMVQRYLAVLPPGKRSPEEAVRFVRGRDLAAQRRTVEELERAAAHTVHTPSYRIAIADATQASVANKAALLARVNYRDTLAGAGATDFAKVTHWLDSAFRLPFFFPAPAPAPAPAGAAAQLAHAWRELDRSTYGLLPAKQQLVRTMARWLANPAAAGGALAFQGPPGTGKTSLARSGICAALGRAFAFIPLGGARNGNFLSGFAYTYEGATWGRIAQALMDTRSTDPVLYFDELDKLTDSPQGREVENELVHITDPVQNGEFQDRFFAGLSLPLNRCLCVFSYNDESRVSAVLRDRLTVVNLPGYSAAEKTQIAQRHLVAACLADHGMAAGDVVFSDEVVARIIELAAPEEGVRNLKRAIEAVVGHVNLQRLTAADGDTTYAPPYAVRTDELRAMLPHAAAAKAWSNMYV